MRVSFATHTEVSNLGSSVAADKHIAGSHVTVNKSTRSKVGQYICTVCSNRQFNLEAEGVLGQVIVEGAVFTVLHHNHKWRADGYDTY